MPKDSKTTFLQMQPKPYLIFMDETGTISGNDTDSKVQVQQPYFALGIIRLLDTSDLMAKVYTIPRNSIEFKFAQISKRGYAARAEKIIDLCLNHKPFYFCCFIIDKTKIKHRDKTTWELQIEFAKKHIEEHCKDGYACVVADYLSRPKSVSETFEESLRKSSKVFNAFMVESESSIFIQIVDLLIGAIAYKYKLTKNPKFQASKYKLRVANFLENQLKIKQQKAKGKFPFKGKLSEQFVIKEKDFYFSVYEK